MKYQKLHPWNVDYKRAAEIQGRLEKSIVLICAAKNFKIIAGADVSYLPTRTIREGKRSSTGTKKGKMFYASVMVFELKTMERVEAVTASGIVDFPYIPGLLSFRESPILLKAFAKIKSNPDVIILDAQGIAHPRGIGLASHIGLLLDKPTIGCAKTRLIGDYNEVGEEMGCYSPLTVQDKVVGAVLRTRKNVKPVFVSPGHKIDLKTSIGLILKSCRGCRLPEPIRQAHNLVKKTATGKE
ncbi:deoxyinosine 3'endonuclease [Candidatus Scalindua japonica]|uniref:Endonuclease V n=1 Tax=Candidatus Scalindua japonica TaxID=1284222 RepID=A0A286U105_9BACT|nr:endonuclease V [Candidatus Scalindua japonica]GAX61802.1 deoxyinosine 3'endonuclease [Candidatus Scalindua japonica]